MSDMPRDELVDVLIVGAGISGINAAIRLSGAGRSFHIVERRERIGGTWDLFRYPGIRPTAISIRSVSGTTPGMNATPSPMARTFATIWSTRPATTTSTGISPSRPRSPALISGPIPTSGRCASTPRPARRLTAPSSCTCAPATTTTTTATPRNSRGGEVRRAIDPSPTLAR